MPVHVYWHIVYTAGAGPLIDKAEPRIAHDTQGYENNGVLLFSRGITKNEARVCRFFIFLNRLYEIPIAIYVQDTTLFAW